MKIGFVRNPKFWAKFIPFLSAIAFMKTYAPNKLPPFTALDLLYYIVELVFIFVVCVYLSMAAVVPFENGQADQFTYRNFFSRVAFETSKHEPAIFLRVFVFCLLFSIAVLRAFEAPLDYYLAAWQKSKNMF